MASIGNPLTPRAQIAEKLEPYIRINILSEDFEGNVEDEAICQIFWNTVDPSFRSVIPSNAGRTFSEKVTLAGTEILRRNPDSVDASLIALARRMNPNGAPYRKHAEAEIFAIVSQQIDHRMLPLLDPKERALEARAEFFRRYDEEVRGKPEVPAYLKELAEEQRKRELAAGGTSEEHLYDLFFRTAPKEVLGLIPENLEPNYSQEKKIQAMLDEMRVLAPEYKGGFASFPGVLDQVGMIRLCKRLFAKYPDSMPPRPSEDLKVCYRDCLSWLMRNKNLIESIEELDLSDLNLTSVPTVIRFFKNLKRLDLSGNPLTEVAQNLPTPNVQINYQRTPFAYEVQSVISSATRFVNLSS